MVVKCTANCGRNAILKRPKTLDALCKECFYWAFETEVHETIINGKLFKRGDRVVIGASGGKDSTVLAYVMKTLNQRYDYGLELLLLSIDEGITGYRDDSLETVKQNRDDYEMPLKILSYKDLYGWTMDEIVAQIGRKNNCTFCGVFRRQALDRGASQLKADCIATGHNADDIAETVLMNVLRGDLPRLRRCTASITKGEEAVPRVKPLKYAYEKEIVLYAYHRKLLYFSTECVFAPNAYRGHARELLKDLERVRPSIILDLIHSGESLCVEQTARMPEIGVCKKCGYVSSQEICKACFLLEGLNRGLPRLGVGKTSVSKRRLADELVKDAEKLCCSGGNCQTQNPCSSKNEQSVIAIGNAIKKVDIEDMLVNKPKLLTGKKHKQNKSKESNRKSNGLIVENQSSSSVVKEVNQSKTDQKDLEMVTKTQSNDLVISVNENNITKEVKQNKFDQKYLEWKPNCNNCSQNCNCVSDDRSKFALIRFLKQLNADYADDEIDAFG